MARYVKFNDGRSGLAINVDHIRYVTPHLGDRAIVTFDNERTLTIMEPFDRVVDKLNGPLDHQAPANVRLSA